MAFPRLNNTKARNFFLHSHGLGEIQTGKCTPEKLLSLIHQLGFVQVDSINTVARAHHMILHSRLPAYRVGDLDILLEKDHSLFEHWTHDASIIPTAFFPYWKLRFGRDGEMLRKRWKNWRRGEFEGRFDTILEQIRQHGPVSSSDVGKNETRKSGGWWDWHPSKTALEYLWRNGQLSVVKRVGFQKYYDLTERVFSKEQVSHTPEQTETIDWCCSAALDRLGYATAKELAAFWDIITLAEAKEWCAKAIKTQDIIEIEVENSDGSWRLAFARPDAIELAQSLPIPSQKVRILSPFDPLLRDRARAERLFGFHYRIEVFVPAAKRKYGYYVFPILQGNTLIGRIDCKAHRDCSTLKIKALWLENGVKPTKDRLGKLQSELGRIVGFSGCETIEYAENWLRNEPG